jgi:hypothetical protein
MAVTTWDGSSSTDWNTAANWDTGAVPTSADDVIIPDDSTTANDCTLSATGGNPKNVKSLKIEANGTIVGGGIQIRIYGESAAGFALDNDGIISGSLFLEIKSDSTVSCDFAGSSGRFNSVTVNHASCIINVESTFHIDGNLTITLGKVICGGNTVEIAGKTTIGDAGHSSEDQATLQCDASAMFLGSGYTSDNAIIMLQGGTYVGGSGNHTSGAIKQTAAHTKLTFTTATHTINAEYPSDDRLFSLTAGKSFNADGRITLEGNFTSYIQWDTTAGDNGPHNLRLNDANLHAKLRTPMTIEGDLVIDAGRLNTQYDGTDHKDLTVTGYCDVTGTLTLNTSTVSVAALRCKSGAAVTQDATGTLALATGSNFGGTEGSTYSLRNLDGTSDINLGGTTTVTGGSYFEPRTATVYASVLNNIVWNSGQYWVGEIRIGGTLVVNAAKHMQPYGGSKNVNVVGAVTLNGQLSAYPNGHADLNNMSFASLDIANGGTYAATTGTTNITSGNFNNSGTFTHNDGMFKFTHATNTQNIQSAGSVEPVFYKLDNAQDASGGTVVVWKSITVVHTLSQTGGRYFQFKGDQGSLTITLGSSAIACTVTEGNRCLATLAGAGPVNIYGADQLKPFVITTGGPNHACTEVHYKWGDYSANAFTTQHNITIDGDMKFGAMTVASGDELDLNGQRVEFGGAFDLTTGALAMNDAMAVFKHTIDFNGRVPTSNTGTTIIHNPPSTSEKLITSLYFGGTFFAQGAESDVNGYAWQGASGSGEYPAKVFVGGQLDCQQSVKTTTTMQVATGGELRGNDRTITCEGDFTTSGGLIGKSALNLTGSEEVTGSDNLDEVATTNKFTIEAWFKASTDANYRAIFSRGTSWATGNLYVYMNSDGYVQASANDLGNTLTSTTAGLADDKWHHVAYTYDTTTISLYIDGKLEATAASTAGAWAGAGTFIRGTSNVKLTGNGSASFAGTSTEFNNLEVASSSKTTTFVSVGGDDKRPVIRGTLTHGGGTLTTSTNCSIDIGTGGTVSSGADTSGLYFTRWYSTTALPALTSKYLSLQTNVDLAGDQTNTQYIQFYNNHNTFDFNITTKRIISYANSNVTMGAGTIEFTSTIGWGSNVYDNRVFTAGPGATIKGVGAKSGFASGNNWSVVGKIENLDVTNEELKVTGQVINCTGDIHQYFPTIDHSQQLDADTADDRDVRLGRDLDKNTELINS